MFNLAPPHARYLIGRQRSERGEVPPVGVLLKAQLPVAAVPCNGPRTEATISRQVQTCVFRIPRQRFTCSFSMTVYPIVSLWILVITAGTLFWVALTDLREFKVRNELVVVLASLLFRLCPVLGGFGPMQWNLAFALLMLAAGTCAIGGGDLKLLTVAFLWTGPWLAAPFVILLLVFAIVYYAAAKLGFAAARPTSAGLRIPLAHPWLRPLSEHLHWASSARAVEISQRPPPSPGASFPHRHDSQGERTLSKASHCLETHVPTSPIVAMTAIKKIPSNTVYSIRAAPFSSFNNWLKTFNALRMAISA